MGGSWAQTHPNATGGNPFGPGPAPPTGSNQGLPPGYHFDASGAPAKDAPSAQDAANSQKKSAGQAPDYRGAATDQAQTAQQNVNTQTLQNRADTSNPFSNQTWTMGPDGRPILSQSLNGGLGTAGGSLLGQAGQSLSGSLDPSLFNPVGNGEQARDQAITGAYNQATSRLNPQFAQQEQLLSSRLAGQGLDPNSQAYRNAMTQFGQQRNDAYGSAMNSAIGQGTAAQQATFGENVAAQQNNIANALRQRETPLSELGMLQNFSTQQPQYNAAGVAEAPQLLAAMADLGNYNIGNANQSNQIVGSTISAGGSALSGLAGVASMSDERAKTDIHRLPIEAEPGVPYATFAYKKNPKQKYLGVIAQDLEKVAPERVKKGADGFKYVIGAPFKAL